MPNYWNPWHGCTKISAGCKHCYVYRQDAMYGAEIRSSEVRKNADFNLPTKRKRDKIYKLPSGQIIYTCMTSDFFVDEGLMVKMRDEKVQKIFNGQNER